MGSNHSLEIKPKEANNHEGTNEPDWISKQANNEEYQIIRRKDISPKKAFQTDSTKQIKKACPVESVYIDLTEERNTEVKQPDRQIKVKKNQRITLEDFEIKRCIGIGGFSTVVEVMKKDTQEFYAMKIIQKSMIEKKSKIKQIMAERNILKMIDHPFLINLHWAFKSNDYLHMVLDYCPGGEFFYHLSRNGKLDEEIARFYFCEVLLALEYLHNNGVIYRDLKPENILLDIEGHVVLTDFGLSKTNFTRDTLSHSFCGSPEYMSPEMLEETGHGFSIDIYSLGALLYEFLTGLPPHYSQDRNELFHNICNNKLTLPDYLSFEAKDLLKRLLKKNPNERLGAIDGIGEIKFHPFCETIDFDALAEKRYVPPFIPEKDEFYFDTDYLKTQIEENPENYFPINDILKNESKESVNHEILLDRHTITELNEFPEGLYGEKQSGSINVSLQESTYKGYSFYKAASETSESCDCSLVSTQYKISDRINDLNTSKLTKETQFELPKEEISSKEPKFMSSQYSSNDFDIDETKNDPFEEEIFVEETTERVNISTEPEILKPHIGNNTKTKRQRNLEEYCIDKSETQNMETESDFIDEFLESFDTELQDIQENESFNDIEEHEDDHDLKLQYYSSYLSSKMENYSSFNNKKASVNFIQKEKALTSVKPPQKKIKVNHTLTRNQNSFCEKLVQISQHKESEDNSIINFDSLKRPCKEVNLKKYASARISCERIPTKNIIKKQNMCCVNTTKQVENLSKTSRDTQNRTFKLPPRSGHFNNSSTSYLHKQKFLSRDNSLNDSKSYNRINSQLGFNRTTRMSKNPKLMAEAEEKRNTNSYIRNLSCNKSIGGEVRESNPTKTMTNMKLSFESNNWPGTMMDFMNSKISQNSPFDPCSSIDSDVIVKTEHLRKPLSHSKAQIKKPQNQQRDSYAPLRTIDHRRGSKTPMLEAKIANNSIDRTIDSRMQDSFLTSTLKLANMHLNKKLTDTSDRDSSMIDRSRNGNIKYSTYSEQASIAKLNRLNIDHESKSFSSRIKTKHQNNQFVFEKSNKTNTLTASVVNSIMDNRYGRYSHTGEDSRSHCARSKPKFDNVERKSVLNASKNTKIIQNFSSSNLIKKSKPTFSRKKGSYIQKHDNPLSRAQSARAESQPYEYEVRNITLNCESGFESKPSLKRTKDSLGSFIDETKMSSCHTKPSYSSSRSKIIPKRSSAHPNTHSKLAGIGNYKRRQAHF
ncbi:unnamed protein product [Moneuplotes crassus]|uniref:Uncharacterized protein n=1 Tax=Euplotes crassus TaxID=5936 RepID=A0AAD1U9H3_EUPCR|nr:unnamed protein product [Moneuplotes crassus]